MAADPVAYAEKTLGVHEPWEEAQLRVTQHDQALEVFNSCKAHLRDIHERMADREQQVLADGRAKYQELSATAFGPVAKGLLQNDPELKELRAEERSLQFQQDEAEASVKHHALGLQVLAARMTALGGLLNFYAAAKQNTMSNTSNTTK